jgi:subtilisin family serine protease
VTAPLISRSTGAAAIASPICMTSTAEGEMVVGELPTYNHHLSVAPSAMLTGPLEAVLALADQVLANDAATLAAYDIRDRTAREEIFGHRMQAALLRGDVAGVKAAAADIREIQDRPDRKLAMGMIEEMVVEAFQSTTPEANVAELVRERFCALPYPTIEAWVKVERAAYATSTPDLILGRVRNTLDQTAEKSAGQIDQAAAAAIVAARVNIQFTCRVASEIATELGRIIDVNGDVETNDIWPSRDVILRDSAKATPVAIAVWDSGVDLSLFEATSDHGLAIDGEGRPMPDLLRPLGEYKNRMPEFIKLLKGVFDLRAGQMTPEAADYQQAVTTLKPEEVKEFSESLGLAGAYIHGTHVAGIAVAGNPYALIQAVTMHFPVRQEDFKLDREISGRRAAFYREAVKRMQAAAVRVVNMSWRFGPEMFDAMLAVQGGVPDAEERKRLATELFGIEKSALDEAIRAAPEILFVAGAGNEGNDSNFSDYIPAGLSIPNLITVGAVDQAGQEALFTSVGGTVAIYANGVEINSLVPGGGRLEVSGTSMASPQVANAAAKLVALKPELTGIQLRTLLLESAALQGRVKLLNTKAAFALAGIRSTTDCA